MEANFYKQKYPKTRIQKNFRKLKYHRICSLQQKIKFDKLYKYYKQIYSKKVGD